MKIKNNIFYIEQYRKIITFAFTRTEYFKIQKLKYERIYYY